MASKYDDIGALENAPKKRDGNVARGLVGQLEQGTTFGFGDELKAMIAATYAMAKGGDKVGKFEDLYDEALTIIREDLDAAQSKHPYLSAGLQVAGAIPTGVAGAKAFPKALGMAKPGANLTNRALHLAKAGAIEGAIAGAGTGEGGAVNRAIGAGQGAAGGAVLAPVVGETSRLALINAGRAAVRAGSKGKKSLKLNPKDVAKNRAEQAFVDKIYNRDDLLEGVDDARKVMKGAKDQGIDITTAEAFDDPDLLGMQGELRDRPGKGAVRARALAEKRQNVQLPDAFEKQIKDVSSVGSQDDAGKRLVGAAKEAEKKVRSDLSAKAKPFYDKAYKAAVPTESPLFSNQRITDYIDQVRKDFPEYKSLPDNNIQVLDEAKKLMDDDIRSALSGSQPDRKVARLIGRAKDQLLSEMDKHSPDYAQARKTYAEGAPEIDALVEERVGKLSKVKPENYAQAPKELVKGSVEQTANIAKRLPKEDLRAGAASLLMDARDAVRGEAFDTIQKRIFNTPKQQAQYQELLGDKYEPFVKLMDTFQRVGKGQRYLQGSPTQPKLSVAKSLDDALSDVANDLIDNKPRFGTFVVRKLTGTTPEIKSAKEMKLYEDFADMILTERGIDLVDQLAKAKPTIEQTRKIVSAIQAGSTASTASLISQFIGEGKPKDRSSVVPSSKYDEIGVIEDSGAGGGTVAKPSGPLKLEITPADKYSLPTVNLPY